MCHPIYNPEAHLARKRIELAELVAQKTAAEGTGGVFADQQKLHDLEGEIKQLESMLDFD